MRKISEHREELFAFFGGERKVSMVLDTLFVAGCIGSCIVALLFSQSALMVRTFLYIDVPLIILGMLDILFSWMERDRKEG